MARRSIFALVIFGLGALIVALQLSTSSTVVPHADAVCHAQTNAPEHSVGQRQRGARPEPDPGCTYTAVGASGDGAPQTSPSPAAVVRMRNQEPREFSARLEEAPLLQMPGYVDSNSPAFWDGENLTVLNSALGESYRGAGPNLTSLDNVAPVRLPQSPREGQAWIESVWRDTDANLLYGWYHFEPSDLPCLTAPLIGAAVSRDDGETWEDRGLVLQSPYDIDCDYANGYFVGGNGDFSVVASPDRRYFYFLFTNYGGPLEEQGIAVARSAFEDRGQPGTVFKYYDAKWEQPGIDGKAAPVFPTETSWRDANVDSFWGPSVHWNTYLRSYVALLNRAAGDGWAQEGIYVAYSRDLVRWTLPQKIADSPDWYPQVIGLGPGESDTVAGRLVRLFVGGQSVAVMAFDRTPGQGLPTGDTPLLSAPRPTPEPQGASSGEDEVSAPRQQSQQLYTYEQADDNDQPPTPQVAVPQFVVPRYGSDVGVPQVYVAPIPVVPPPIAEVQSTPPETPSPVTVIGAPIPGQTHRDGIDLGGFDPSRRGE